MRKILANQGFRILLSYLITAFMLWVVFKNLRFSDLTPALTNKTSVVMLSLAVILVIVANLLRAWRWVVILNNPDVYTFSRATRSTFLGLWFNIVSTTGANDFLKPFHLSLITKTSFWKIFGSCVAERFFDAFFTVLLLFAGGIIVYDALNVNFLLGLLIAGGTTGVSVVMLFLKPDSTLLTPARFILPPTWFRQLRVYIYHVHKGGFHIRSPKVFARASLLTVLYWSCNVAANSLLFAGLFLPMPVTTLKGAVTITGMMSAGWAVPGTIAGAGTMNYAVVAAMEMLAAANQIVINPALQNKFLIYSVLVYFSNFIPDLLAGGIAYWKERHILFSTRKPNPVNTL